MLLITLLKQEVFKLLNSFAAYLAIGFYLLLTGMYCWVFPSTSILASGYASLDVFFHISPYILLLMVPAISMHSIAGERAEGTLVLLLMKPVSGRTLLLGKWLAIVAVCILALVPTLIYYFSVYYLGAGIGNVDSGAVVGSYIGLFLLTGSFSAIGVFSSAIARSTIIAYLLGVFLCFIFYEGIAVFSETVSWTPLIHLMDFLSLSAHYQSLGRGVLDSRDIFALCSISLVFLALAIMALLRGRANKPTWRSAYIRIISLFFILVTGNICAHSYFTRWDFTAEKRFTLSASTKDLLLSIDDEVHIAVFLEGDLPTGFKRLQTATADMLADLRSYSRGKLHYSFINALESNGSHNEEIIRTLAHRGIEPVNLNLKTEDGLTQKIIFPSAVVMYKDREIPVSLLQQKMYTDAPDALNSSVQHLEYAFANALHKLQQEQQATIAFTEGHGELTDLELQGAFQSLSHGYLVGRLHLDSISFEDLLGIEVIVVAQPKAAFTDLEKFKLDYFVQHGGNVLWAINPSSASLDNLRSATTEMIVARQLNLDDLLFRYGIRFHYDLLADMNCAQIPLQLAGGGQIQLVPWVYYPLLVPLSTHPIVKDLELIKTEFPSTMDTVITSVPIHKEFLLWSSPYNKLFALPTDLSLSAAANFPDTASFRGPSRPISALLEGKFPSAYHGRATPKGVPESVTLAAVAAHESKMIAIADGHVLKSQLDAGGKQAFPLGWDKYGQVQYGNRAWLQNMIDYLAEDTNLLSLRNKDFKLRPLDMVYVKDHKATIQLLNVGLPLLLLLVFGGIQQYMRYVRFGK